MIFADEPTGSLDTGTALEILGLLRESVRAIGATPRQVRRMVMGEATVVAVLATALAWPLTVHIGWWLLGQLAGRGVLPDVVVYHQGDEEKDRQ